MPFSLFDHIGSHHPFGGELARLRDMVNAESSLHRLLDASREEPVVHAEVKALPAADGGFAFDRFYWSLQVKVRDQSPGLAAMTLTAAPPKGQLDWLTFPDDPYLSHAKSLLTRAGSSIEVLRYVPLRRLTFIERDAQGRKRIGKIKRRSRYKEAFGILRDVARAVEGAGTRFAVSEPLALDDEQALYLQSCLSGEPVPDLITAGTGEHLMAEIGRVHAEVHRIPPWPEMRTLSNTDLLHRAGRDIALIHFYVPELGDALATIAPLLKASCPGEDVRTVCHGDFVASQLLLDGGNWSVIDFDLVTLADPYHDLSIFLASLDYDVPWLEKNSDGSWKERFGAAYLAGYCEARGCPVDARRLAWHRLAAEIYYLALMLKKDRFELTRALRRVAFVRTLAEHLA